MASNPPPIVVGLSAGDVVTVTFGSPTRQVANVTFRPDIGRTLSAWRSNSVLVVTVVAPPAGVEIRSLDVAQGLVNVTVSGVQSFDGRSQPLPPVEVVVSGTWGTPTPPQLLRAVASDDGHNVGLWTNDSLTLVFDENVTRVAVGDTGAVLALLAFQPALPSTVSLAGEWTDNLTLRVVFSFPGGGGGVGAPAGFDWYAYNVGSLTVTVQEAAGLKSAGGESTASNSSIVMDAGSWGDVPTAAVQQRSATSVRFIVAPPDTAVGYAVTSYALVWWTGDGSDNDSEDRCNPLTQHWRPASVRSLASQLPGDGGSGAGDGTNTTAAAPCQFAVELGVSADNASCVFSTEVVTVSSGSTLAAGVVTGSAALAQWTGSPSSCSVGVALVTLDAPYASVNTTPSPVPPPVVAVKVGRLTSNVSYAFAVAVALADGTFGPLVMPIPAALTPQPPSITAVTMVGSGLPTRGGAAVTLTGSQLGLTGDVVVMTLSNSDDGAARGLSFSSLSCVVVVPSTVIECAAPPGLGRGYGVSVTVDNVTSDVYTTTRLSYGVPVITDVYVVDDSGATAAASTSGGDTVVLRGDNFGPVTLSAVALAGADAVTYYSSASASDAGGGLSATVTRPSESYRARACRVTVDHVQVTCVTSAGVGGRLLWTVVVANQSSNNPRTSYHSPIVAALVVTAWVFVAVSRLTRRP